MAEKNHFEDQDRPKIVRKKEREITLQEQNSDLSWLKKAAEEQTLLEEKRQAFSKLKKVVDRCSNSLDQYLTLLENMKVMATLLERNHTRMEESEADLANWVGKVYDRFCAAHFIQIPSLKKHEENEAPAIMHSPSSVAAAFHKDYFIVRTGRLFSRNMNQYKYKDDHPMYRSQPIFKEEIIALLEKNKEKIQGFDQKNITVLSVYNDHHTTMVDNDNLEFKGIIDAIAQFTNGDDALSTSLTIFSLVNSDLQEGTYFIVTKRYGVGLTIFEAVHFLTKSSLDGTIVKTRK